MHAAARTSLLVTVLIGAAAISFAAAAPEVKASKAPAKAASNAPTKTLGTPSKKESNAERLITGLVGLSAAMLVWKLSGKYPVLPLVCVVLALAGSSAMMKLAPAAGVIPGDFDDQIVAAYDKFGKLFLGPGHGKQLMLLLAALHGVAVLFLLLPAGVTWARVAGAWAMVAMIGAEYCTRMTGFVPPGVPAGVYPQLMVEGFMSVTHLVLFMCGFLLVAAKSTPLGLSQYIMAKKGAGTKDANAKGQDESQRGRPATTDSKSTKRDTTPVPKNSARGRTVTPNAAKEASSTKPSK